jgi:hypothetical protein
MQSQKQMVQTGKISGIILMMNFRRRIADGKSIQTCN